MEYKENVSAKAKDPGFWRELWQQARLVFALMRDPEVPFYLKLLPFLAVLYLFFPADIIPDIFLGLGQLDDVTILLVGSKIFVELSPAHVVARHLDHIRQQDGYLANSKNQDDKQVEDAIIIEGEFESQPKK